MEERNLVVTEECLKSIFSKKKIQEFKKSGYLKPKIWKGKASAKTGWIPEEVHGIDWTFLINSLEDS